MAHVTEAVLAGHDRLGTSQRAGERSGHLTHGARLPARDVVRRERLAHRTGRPPESQHVGMRHIPHVDEVAPLPTVLEDTWSLTPSKR